MRASVRIRNRLGDDVTIRMTPIGTAAAARGEGTTSRTLVWNSLPHRGRRRFHQEAGRRGRRSERLTAPRIYLMQPATAVGYSRGRYFWRDTGPHTSGTGYACSRAIIVGTGATTDTGGIAGNPSSANAGPDGDSEQQDYDDGDRGPDLVTWSFGAPVGARA
jgi:hypothetical protein